MTTLQQLVDQCEIDLKDAANATWAAADIERWLRDGIAAYSLYFPRVLSQGITTAAGDHKYDLAAGFLEALSVEYPTGEDPPEYLERRPYLHPDFWEEDGFYDVVHHDDAVTENEIWISESPSASQTITVLYKGTHDNTISLSNDLTVPLEHEHILRMYVRWQAIRQRQAVQEANPTSNSSLLMSQLAANARLAERGYVDALARALNAAGGGRSGPVSWANQGEETTRIY